MQQQRKRPLPVVGRGDPDRVRLPTAEEGEFGPQDVFDVGE